MTLRGKTEKISVTLPRGLAGEVRSVAGPGEVSTFFAEALEHYLAVRRQGVSLRDGFGAWKDRGHPDLSVPEDSTAYVRSLRQAGRPRLIRDGRKRGK